MSVQRSYYALKPLMPWRLRVEIRRMRARFLRWKSSEIWPILPRAALKPDGWPGWPEGKRFAVVLTHDVEGAFGMSQTDALARLEEEEGMRSSFNIVPEGGYDVPRALREDLVRRGFEIGVHGLKHDGKLYNSREIFRERATRINAYLKDWGAVGFRSPFMHHNLNWIHDLEILYDASTFDTDPFEIQSDGAETLFPFWVPGIDGRPGYMELPYTLVQDFTLFTVLHEKTINLWKQKVDWIAESGGMVLLNVHPDYVHFGTGDAPDGLFKAELYRELLSYIKTKYTGQFWQALPRDVALYCKAFKPIRPAVSRRKVCMLAYSHVESDNRIIRYASALTQRGDDVDVVSLDSIRCRPRRELLNGFWINRIQKRIHNETSKWEFLSRVLGFTVRAAWTLGVSCLRKRYDLIHVHNIPDFLVFSALIPRLTGSRVILDIHDIVPEFFGSKFKTGENWITEVLKIIERSAAHFSTHVIISNHLWYGKVTNRSVDEAHCSTFINYIDLKLFHQRDRTRKDGPFVVIFPGGFQWHQGLDLAIRAFKEFLKTVPNAEFRIYGHGDQKENLLQLIKELDLEQRVKIYGVVEVHEVPELLANADLGVVPKRANSFGNEAYSTKIMEFMSQGLPVVVSRTKIDSFYFTDKEVLFFESDNVQQMATAMVELATNTAARERLVEGGKRYIAANNWNVRKSEYLSLVDRLIEEESVTLKP